MSHSLFLMAVFLSFYAMAGEEPMRGSKLDKKPYLFCERDSDLDKAVDSANSAVKLYNLKMIGKRKALLDEVAMMHGSSNKATLQELEKQSLVEVNGHTVTQDKDGGFIVCFSLKWPKSTLQEELREPNTKINPSSAGKP